MQSLIVKIVTGKVGKYDMYEYYEKLFDEGSSLDIEKEVEQFVKENLRFVPKKDSITSRTIYGGYMDIILYWGNFRLCTKNRYFDIQDLKYYEQTGNLSEGKLDLLRRHTEISILFNGTPYRPLRKVG